MDLRGARELHAANRFRRIGGNELGPGSESNLACALSTGVYSWGGLLPLLPLPFVLAWRWSRRARGEARQA